MLREPFHWLIRLLEKIHVSWPVSRVTFPRRRFDGEIHRTMQSLVSRYFVYIIYTYCGCVSADHHCRRKIYVPSLQIRNICTICVCVCVCRIKSWIWWYEYFEFAKNTQEVLLQQRRDSENYSRSWRPQNKKYCAEPSSSSRDSRLPYRIMYFILFTMHNV